MDNPTATPASVAVPPTPSTPVVPNAGASSAGMTTSTTPTPTAAPSTIGTSTGPTVNPPQMGNIPMPTASSNFDKIAWVMENGEVKCASCETYYTPESFEHARIAHCGFPDCADAEGVVDYNQVGPHTFVPNGHQDDHFTLAAGKIAHNACGLCGRDGEIEENGYCGHCNDRGYVAKDGVIDEGDTVNGKMIKTTEEEDTHLASTQDYLDAFTRVANDSKMYYRGYEDARAGRELDEDLAELSDDYFHGYQQYTFYNQTNQDSAPQTLFDIKPNSNLAPRAELTQGHVDRGPNELTDGHGYATAGKKVADPLDFARQLSAQGQYKRQQKEQLSQQMRMNMMFMEPAHDQAESAKKQTDAVCQMCKTLGHTDDHASHAPVKTTIPQGGAENQPLPPYIVSSKLPFPTDVVEKFLLGE